MYAHMHFIQLASGCKSWHKKIRVSLVSVVSRNAGLWNSVWVWMTSLIYILQSYTQCKCIHVYIANDVIYYVLVDIHKQCDWMVQPGWKCMSNLLSNDNNGMCWETSYTKQHTTQYHDSCSRGGRWELRHKTQFRKQKTKHNFHNKTHTYVQPLIICNLG